MKMQKDYSRCQQKQKHLQVDCSQFVEMCCYSFQQLRGFARHTDIKHVNKINGYKKLFIHVIMNFITFNVKTKHQVRLNENLEKGSRLRFSRELLN